PGWGGAARLSADGRREGGGKSAGPAVGPAASLLMVFWAAGGAGAFACILARRDISAARPRMPFGASARDRSAGCGGAAAAGEDCGGKPPATRWRAVEGSDWAGASRRAGSTSPAGGAL